MTPTATGSSTGPGTLAGATSLAGPTTAWAHLAGYAPPQPVSIEERPLSSAASVPIPTRDEYLGSSYYTERAPIVIDNGSSELRAGFGSAAAAQPTLAFENVVSRFRDRKKNQTVLIAGAEAYSDTQARGSIRSAFDGDVITSTDVVEYVLDYTFLKLGISTEGSIEHPILMSETLCNPAFCRSQTTELLFETYRAPSINYGLDSLFSAHANGLTDALVVSSGHASTTVIPLVAGRGLLSSAKRLRWGGAQASEYLLKLVQLKYPAFPVRATPLQAGWMHEKLTYTVPDDYQAHLARLADPDELAKEDCIVQFPYTVEQKDEKSAEELERQAERKRENGRRLQEQTNKLRLEKLLQKENDLQYYAQLKEWKSKEKKAEYAKRLEAEGFETEQDLENTIKKIQSSLKRSRAKDLGINFEEVAEEPTFPLVNVPDHTLDEEGIKEKRRQRLMKAGYDARNRAKVEKEEERRAAEEQHRRDEEERRNDPRAWAAKIRQEYEESIAKAKERVRLKEALADRKSLAAQNRMKTIANLASEQPEGKRKRGRGGDKDDDHFGADDADWAVYREIKAGDDSEEEDDEAANLQHLEQRLLAHDPSFTESDTWAAQEARKNKLTSTFLRGYWPPWDAEDVAQAHQLHLNVERARVPEVLWQPSMAGVDQAGLDELCAHLLRNYEHDTRVKLANNIFVTGRHTSYAHFDARLHHAVRATQPTDVRVRVVRAANVRFDAWRGMAKWSLSQEFKRSSVSRAEYEEHGAEWFKEHAFSSALLPY